MLTLKMCGDLELLDSIIIIINRASSHVQLNCTHALEDRFDSSLTQTHTQHNHRLPPVSQHMATGWGFTICFHSSDNRHYT